MQVKEYDYIRGNTALAPEKKVIEKESYKEKKKKHLEEQRKYRKNQSIKAKKTISYAVLLAILGVTTLTIDSYVYKIQKDLSNLEIGIKHEQDINDAINVELLKLSSIENVSEIASKDMGMVYPSKSSTITIDMSKEYFGHIKNQKKDNKKNLIAKIMESFN